MKRDFIKIVVGILLMLVITDIFALKPYSNQWRRTAAFEYKKGSEEIFVKSEYIDDKYILLSYSLPEAEINTINKKIENKTVSQVFIGDAPQAISEGEPIVPVIPVKTIIPKDYSPDLKNITVDRKDKILLSGVHFINYGEATFPLMPGIKPRKVVPKKEIYDSDNAFPQKSFDYICVQKKHGVSIAYINLYPITYHPKSGKVFYYKTVSLKIPIKKTRTTKGSYIKGRIENFNYYQTGADNPEALKTYITRGPAESKVLGICNPLDSYRYVLVTNQALRDATTDVTVRDLVAHKQARGLSTTIVTTETIYATYSGVDNAEKLRNFIIDAYTNWGTEYVLLGGDINIIPMRSLYCNSASGADNIPSDLYYQCLDGNYNSDGDSYWGEPTDGPGGADVDLMAEVSIGRASAENAQEMSNFVYKTLAYENESDAEPSLRKVLMIGEQLGFGGPSEYADSSMEEIRLGSNKHGYTTTGFATCPLFNVKTLYDSPTFTWSKQTLIDSINSERFSIFNHLGHANADYVMKLYNADADAVTNNKFIFAYSQGCIPGNFEVDCIAEHFTTSNRHGMYAVVFNARYGWGRFSSTDGPSQRFHRQFWDAYFSEYMYNLGIINADSHEDNIWDINGENIRWCFYETNLLGDPQTPMRGQITGPSVTYSSHLISDVSGGNGDGLINPGEQIQITATLMNVGSEVALGVDATLSSSDTYVSIQNNNASFGDIQCCGATKQALDNYGITISPSCPTPHTVTFDLNITDSDTGSWTSQFTITVYTSSQISGYARTFTGTNPVAGATVQYSGPLSGSVTTNSSGYYMFGAINGTYSVFVRHNDYLPSDTQQVTIPPNAVNINFALKRPVIILSPLSIKDTVLVGDSLVSGINIANNGDAQLAFSITSVDHTASTVIMANQLYDESHFIELAKDQKDTRIGIPVALNKGGPDNFGYSWKDSDEPGGPTYVWNDIKATGTLLSTVSGCDDCFQAQPISFLFPFYGNEFDTIYVSSNGFITFGAGSSQIANYPLPSTSAPPNLIDMFHDDLYPSSQGDVYFKDEGTRVIVQFDNVRAYDGSGNYTFQIVLEESGSITLYYSSLTGTLTGCTVGIQNAARNDGLTVVYNASYLKNNLAVNIKFKPDWLRAAPLAATVNPGQSLPIALTLDATELLGGPYYGSLEFLHNDPVSNNPFILPCTLMVDGIRRLSVVPASYNFGTVWVGQHDTVELTLINNGDELTTVTSMPCNNPKFSPLVSLPLSVPPSGEQKVKVVFSPSTVGNETGILRVNSDAEDNPVLTVNLSGTATLPPQISITPSSICRTVNAGDSATGNLTISNSGGDTLRYRVSVKTATTALGLSDRQRRMVTLPENTVFCSDKPDVSSDMAQKTIVIPSLELTSLDLSGVNIMYDVYHGERDTSYVSTLINDVKLRGARIVKNTASITVSSLDSIDILWIDDDGYTTFSAAESTTVVNWIMGGGSLFTHCDAPIFFQMVVRPFGIAFGGSYVSGTTTNIVAHPITDSVFQVYLSGPMTSCIVSGNAQMIVRDIGNNGHACIAEPGNGRIVTVVDDDFHNSSITYANNRRFGNNIIDWLVRGSSSRWLSVSPDSGKVPPESQSNLMAKFTSKNMLGGAYQGAVEITHNSPSSPIPFSVPCTLSVNGFRSVIASPQNYDFGNLWTGLKDTALITLKNAGNEATVVSAIASDNAEFTHAAALPLIVPAFDSVKVKVIFAPIDVGQEAGTLTITSDAEDNPSLIVSLTGTGTASPEIVLNPESFHGSVSAGDSVSSILRITNTGGDNLTIAINAQASGTPLSFQQHTFVFPSGQGYRYPNKDNNVSGESNKPATVFVPAMIIGAFDLTNIRIVYDQSHGQTDSSYSSIFINELKQRGAFVFKNTSLITAQLLETVDVLWLDDGSSTDLSSSERSAIDAWLREGGSVLLASDGPNAMTSLPAPYGILYSSGGTSGITTNILPHPTTDSVSSLYLNSPVSVINDTGDAQIIVFDGSNSGIVGVVEVGRGKLAVVCDELFWDSYISSEDNRVFGHNLFDWFVSGGGHSRWLSVEADTGTLGAGSYRDIAVWFNSVNLLGGNYTGSLEIHHNAPSSGSPLIVPCTISVDGYRRLTVSPASYDFGNLWAGLKDTALITLRNAGNEATVASAITSNNAEFIHGATLPLTVAAFDSVKVKVIFSPLDVGLESGTLNISSNAEDNPQLSVAISGVGTLPPQIVYSPVYFEKNLVAGDSIIDTLHISNTGGDDLSFAINAYSQATSIAGAIDILAWVPYTDMTGEYVNTVSAIAQYTGNYTIDTTKTFTASVLETRLQNKEVFLVMEQENGTIPSGTGTSFRNILDAFLQRGGIIIYLCPGLGGSTTQFLIEAALVELSYVSSASSGNITILDPAHPLFKDITIAPTMLNATSYCTVNNNSTITLATYSTGMVISEKKIHNGYLITLGPDFYEKTDSWARIISNAVQRGPASPEWLHVGIGSGVIPAGAIVGVPVNFNSRGLLGGQYTGILEITHNVPGQSEIHVPCTLHVDGFKRISVSPQSTDFGNIWQGMHDTAVFTLSNAGNESTTVSIITSDNPVFTFLDALPIVISAFDEKTIRLRFSPSAIGAESGTVTIQSDAEDNPVLLVTLSGVGTQPPVAQLEPRMLNYTLLPTDMPADQTSVLSNIGGDTLAYRINSVRETGTPLSKYSGNRTPVIPAISYDLIYNKTNYQYPYVPGRVIVGFKQDKHSFADPTILSSIGTYTVRELATAINPATKQKAYTGRKLVLVMLSNNNPEDVIAAIQKLKNDGNVAYAEPDYIVKAISTPNDPHYALLYAMHNTGQTGGRVDADIDAPEAWDKHRGNRRILIGVIDTGIDYYHPDLAANIWTNPGEIPGNGVDDDGNGFIDDIHGWDFAYDDNNPIDGQYHGTHCAGTIAGVGNNGVGVVGVMWEASLVAIKFLDDAGSGSTTDAIDAVNYATAMGIHITSNSWGGGPFSQALMDAISTGGLFIAAAGNSGSDNDVSPHYPSSYDLDNVIAVAATDHNDNLASFSCYGLTSVDLGAPGVQIYSCQPGTGYQYLDGTSMATPHVSGAAGLIWSYNPLLTALEVKQILMENVDPISSLNGKTVTGGRLNVEKALSAAGPGWLSIAPMEPGSVNPGDSTPFIVTVDPRGLLGGRWQGEIAVGTNDPQNPELIISVIADIDGNRSLVVNPASYDFGNVWVGARDSTVLILRNNGNEATEVSAITSNNAEFIHYASLPLNVPAFDSVVVRVVFTPVDAGPESGILTIASNAEDNPVLSVSLSGVGTSPPVINVMPSSISKAVRPGGITGGLLTIRNTGGDSLCYELLGSSEAPIIINEFCNEPDFIELWNRGRDQNMSGWTITIVDNTSSSGSFTFPSGYVLRNGRRVVLREFTGTVNDSTFYYGVNIGWVENSIVSLALTDNTGRGVDFVRTVNSSTNPPAGTSWSGGGVNFSLWDAARNNNNDSDSPIDWTIASSNTEFRLNPGQDGNGTWPAWLSASRSTGTIPSGRQDYITLIFDATDLIEGTYTAQLIINHNAPGAGPITIPLTLNVGDVIPGVSRILYTGTSAETSAYGNIYIMDEIIIGSPTSGSARGSKYQIQLK